jgi:hypothetical protein
VPLCKRIIRHNGSLWFLKSEFVRFEQSEEKTVSCLPYKDNDDESILNGF